MVERNDPARAGVKAGRVVGLLTAAIAVVSLLNSQGTFYESWAVLLDLLGIDARSWITGLFWGNVAFALIARYTVCYVVGSLIGVVYDWLDQPSLPVLSGGVVVVGALDATWGFLDTFDVFIAGGYFLAWLCYLPAFVWLFDPEAGDDRSSPLRLGN